MEKPGLKILVIGGGGREHALVWKISQSPLVEKIFCAPGNAGIGEIAQRVDIGSEYISDYLDFAEYHGIDLTIVGPEMPLVHGIVDGFNEAGKKIFGPTMIAARLEGDKIHAKKIMDKYGIPTAPWAAFSDSTTALQALNDWQGDDLPVVKFSLLAAGKGVFVPDTREEAEQAIRRILDQQEFGYGGRCLLEKRLRGYEVSVLAFVDGETVVLLPASQDHKRVGEGDTGPNTGGMGAYSPVPAFTPELEIKVMEKIMKPIARAMVAEDMPYKGILYAGLMIVDNEPYVLEFNVRFGDPETQPVLLRLQSDLVEIMLAVCEGRLAEFPPLVIDPRPAVCVVLASKGYPDKYEKGAPILGLPLISGLPDVMVFHAGTALDQGRILTAGGRVLGITAIGKTMEDAIAIVNLAASCIRCDNLFYRKDIGRNALLQIIDKK
jgi:phosphoribosylamine--glycine ligase